MSSSKLIAGLIGPLLLAIGAALLLNSGMFTAMVSQLAQNYGVVFLAGVMGLVGGLAILRFHNIWSADWRVLITIFGWLSVIGGLLNRDYFRTMAKEVAASPALFCLTGVLALVVGGLIVLLHNVWSGWPIVITLVGWAAIAKGVVRTVLPTRAASWVAKVTDNANALMAASLVVLALGAFLTAMGYGLGG